MTTRPPSDSDGWYDPDSPDAAMLRQIRGAGEYRRSDPPERAILEAHAKGWNDAHASVASAPVPEGMETTEARRQELFEEISALGDPGNAIILALLRDLDRALAEIARLKQWEAVLVKERSENHEIYRALAEANAVEIARLTAEQLPVPPDRERLAQELTAPCWETGGVVPYELAVRAAAALRSPADGWREGAEAMREACAKAAENHVPNRGWHIAETIRALPIPSPPAEEAETTARLVRDPAPMIEQMEARIAELEAEVARLKAENHFAGSLTLANQNRIAELEAALTKIANDEEGDYDLLVYIARAALSGEGVTQRGVITTILPPEAVIAGPGWVVHQYPKKPT